MKFKGTNLSKRTIALLAAALVLLGTGGTMGTRAILNVTSNNYDATLVYDQIKVQLTEQAPGESHPSVINDGGTLFSKLEGKAEPGMPYEYKVGVRNNGGAPEYIRVVVHKYWTKDSKKATDLSPALIELNVGDEWISKKISEETTVYYLNKQLSNAANQNDATLFSSFRINDSITSEKTIKHNGTVISEDEIADITSGTITYEYKYNGYKFTVEAEVQSVQTHDDVNAIKSVWGVDATIDGSGNITAIE